MLSWIGSYWQKSPCAYHLNMQHDHVLNATGSWGLGMVTEFGTSLVVHIFLFWTDKNLLFLKYWIVLRKLRRVHIPKRQHWFTAVYLYSAVYSSCTCEWLRMSVGRLQEEHVVLVWTIQQMWRASSSPSVKKPYKRIYILAAFKTLV